MTVHDIVAQYLVDNGYDGLYTDDCGCLLDDLMPCCSECGNCEPGYKASQEEAAKVGYLTDDEYVIWDRKPEEVEDGKE